MNAVFAPLSTMQRPAPVRSIPARRIALPTEHGSWGFLGEPLVAGLAITFSMSAPWIAIMTIGAFLLRQPLRVLVINHLGRRDTDLTATAFRFVLFYFLIFAAGLTGTLIFAGVRPLIPFLIVLPLIAVQAYYDIFRRGRTLTAELAGAISISASVAAVAIAAGLWWPLAVGVALVFIARMIPSILYVRERLRLEKGKSFSYFIPVAAHAAAVVLVTSLAFFAIVPVITVAAMLILLSRAAIGLSAKRTKMRAMQIGVWEVIYGTVTVAILVIGYYAGL